MRPVVERHAARGPVVEWPAALADDGGDATPRKARASHPSRWSLTRLPMAPLLLVGLVLGPQGLALLTPAALAAIDPVLPVALATLGALAGLMPGLQGHLRRSFGVASLTVCVTGLTVVAGFAVGGAVLAGPADAGMGWLSTDWLLPLVLGVSAASSLVVPAEHGVGEAKSTASLESEALASVVAGGLVVAFTRQGSALATGAWLLQACGVVVLLGLAGWLMLRKNVDVTEHRLFMVATLLLVGGAADALSFSALLGGVCAGLLWRAAGGSSRDSLQTGMRDALPPLIAVVLLVAGARAQVSTATIGLAFGYACLRTIGRTSAGIVAVRVGLRPAPRAHMLAPGLFGLAFSLNAARALGGDAVVAHSVVALGTILAELVVLATASRAETT